MDFSLGRLLTTEYYLDINPAGDFLPGFFFLIFFLGLIFLRSIIKKFAPDSKYFRKSIKKKTGKLIVLGILGFIFVIARFSAVPYFSMRIWLYLTFLLSLIFGIMTCQKVSKEYQKRLASVDRETQKKE